MTALGIDTSNYTTSAALCQNGSITENRKLPLPVAPGSRGLRQSDAVFHHTRQLPQLLWELLPQQDLGTIGVSVSPRSAPGSYMPCFLVGKGYAQTLGAALGVPVALYSHQQGHLAAALYSAGRLDLLQDNFLAFHVSGGTTEAVLASPGENGPSAQVVAASLDLKAGQAVDRVGLLLGLRFPCGPQLEELALSWPKAVGVKPSMKGADCSLSGLENRCAAMLRQGRQPAEIARFCIESISAALDAMCARLLEELGPLPVVFSGGVCSNSLLRQRLEAKYGAVFAAPEFSADNAAGVAVLAYLARFCK
ncbi:MAG: peptidase M22 [Acutalibacter sp.]|nr:peptidase M22 [Acutalibacter sp.]